MEDEKDILRRMSSGDSDAFRLVFLKYAPRVEAFAMKMLKNIHEAQDVSQNIFTKLWMQRRELAQVQSLNAYLFRMTRNAVLDSCKHSRIRMQFENSARVDGQILCRLRKRSAASKRKFPEFYFHFGVGVLRRWIV